MASGLGERLAASARLRFRIFGVVVAALFCVSFGAICFELTMIAREADRIDDAWIANTRILGEMSDRLTELRLTQALILLSSQPEAARTQAASHRKVLVESERAFNKGLTSRLSDPSHKAFAAVDAYLEAERDWESNASAQADFDGATKRFYEAADGALDLLIDENAAAAHEDTSRISETSRYLVFVVVAIGLMVCGVKLWTIRRLDSLLFLPLEKITHALTRLSSGQEDVKFPVTDRRDEIGGLASAFERFRQSAGALREAYVATKLAEESAARLARHDSLTGLFNRRHLSSRIDELANQPGDSTRKHFLYAIDLDRFKPINDLYGHASGDMVLCSIANRLRGIVGEHDVVARPGGDEFAILASFDDSDFEADATALAGRISEAIRVPFETGNCEIEVGGSTGVALYGRDGQDADSLIRSADAAMYRAKAQACSGFQFFEESMREQLRAEAELEVDVRSAVTSRAIRPHYQPLVNLRTRRIYGFEILARWSHPARGEVVPDTFIPVIERLGLATPFTLAMLTQACRDSRSWPDHVCLALNVSPRQLIDSLLPAQILAVLTEEDFQPQRLEIEMTESALVSDLDAAKATIENFRKWGIRVSLDDFGTGYSSLHHLRELHFDKVKIDKSFVQAMLCDAESGKIVDAILNLSDNLGLSALAEGIETAELENALRDRGCRYGQGYLFGKAVAPQDVPALLLRSAQHSYHAIA